MGFLPKQSQNSRLTSQWDFSLLKQPKNLDLFNPFALRKAKIVYNFGLSECNRVNKVILDFRESHL